MNDRELRRDILTRYARLSQTGIPKTCKLSTTGNRNHRKIIYNTQKLAQLARNELMVLKGKNFSLSEYVCSRSKDKHWHIKARDN
jgi:hypothetical protein